MRAPYATLAFLLATLGIPATARAHVPLFAPRVSLSLALDWNNLAVRALHAPPRPTAPSTVHRHVVPRLAVTDGAPPPARALDFEAVNRVEGWARTVMAPRYYSASPRQSSRMHFRAIYLNPYTPYLGCYGLTLTVETDALLR